MKTKKCPVCKTRIQKDAAVCTMCGAAFTPDGENGTTPGLRPDELSARVNAIRKKARLYSLLMTISVFFGIFFSIPLLFPEPLPPQAYLLFPFFIMAVYCFYKKFSVRKLLTQLIKVNIVRQLLAETFELEAYEPDGCFSVEQINASGLLCGCARCSGSDLVRGKYKGVPIEFCDIALKEERYDSNGTRHIVTKFRGQWLEISLAKRLSSAVCLGERIGSGAVTNNAKMREVTTDSAAFNKKYRVLAEDPQQAFYILTPHFMEYITAADSAADSVTYFCFMENRVRVAMGRKENERDLFEFGKLGKNVNLDWCREKVTADLRYITGTLDALLKNEFLFGRR